MYRADVLKAEVACLINEQNGCPNGRPVCFVDGKPCFSCGQGCFSQNFGTLGDDIAWACRRLPRSDLDSEPFEWVDFEHS